MNQELDEQLCREFPNLYRKRNSDMQETAMCWGFECNSGWFQIIYDLSKNLEQEILKLPEKDREYCCASQVKEKYGTLRYYMHSETDEMSFFISEAEDKSAITCEQCGQPSKWRDLSWKQTLCEDHYFDQLANDIKNWCKNRDEECIEVIKNTFKDLLKPPQEISIKEKLNRLYWHLRWNWHPRYWSVDRFTTLLKYYKWKTSRCLSKWK